MSKKDTPADDASGCTITRHHFHRLRNFYRSKRILSIAGNTCLQAPELPATLHEFMNTLTTPQRDMLRKYGASDPVPLHEADLSVPLVYYREIGVIHCQAGRHRLAMSGLLAVQYGLESGIEVAEQLGLDFPDETADRWLEDTPGSAFRSSVGRNVLAGKKGSLTAIELRWLGPVTYLFD